MNNNQINKKKIRNYFTSAQIDELCQNPNVLEVSVTSITFTKEFKLLLFKENQNGKTMNQILSENGINPDYLGEKRIESLRSRIKKQIEKAGVEFYSESIQQKSQDEEIAELNNRIKELESKLTTLEHLNAFMKRIEELRKGGKD